jgi:ABC-type Mn2+/Zn2+ transport system permease subunit
VLSLACTFAAVLFFANPRSVRYLPGDTILGIAFTVSAAVAVLFVAHTATGNEEVVHLLQGNLLALTAGEAERLAIVFAAILVVHLTLFKEFEYVSFDPAMAATQGYRTERWNLAFYLLLGLAIALAIKAIGILLMFAFLVIPAALGLLVARGLRGTFVVAMGTALLAVFLGIWLSYRFDFPSGPMIVAVLGGLLLVGAAYRAVAR